MALEESQPSLTHLLAAALTRKNTSQVMYQPRERRRDRNRGRRADRSKRRWEEGGGGKEERNKQNPARSCRQSWCFKMCTGTPHCGSSVQAGDELLIPTSSILTLPFLPLPPAPPLQLCCLQISQTLEKCTERKTKTPVCPMLL